MTWRTVQVSGPGLLALLSRIRQDGGTVVRCCPDDQGGVAVTFTERIRVDDHLGAAG